MYENEGEEVTQQDANEADTSEPQISSPEETNSTSAAERVSQNSQSEKQLPFHEHPRFKELIEEKKTYAEQLQQMQKQMQEMSQRYQQQAEPKKSHPFVERLKEIDPAYGEWAGGLDGLKEQLAEMKAWKDEQGRQTVVREYESSVEKLHTEHKVPKELQELYKEQLDARAYKDPNFGLKDVPAAYKQLHEKYSKFLDATKRAERASYVVDKSKDSSAPSSQSKGAPAGKAKAPQFKDREEAYAAIVKQATTRSKADNDF